MPRPCTEGLVARLNIEELQHFNYCLTLISQTYSPVKQNNKHWKVKRGDSSKGTRVRRYLFIRDTHRNSQKSN